MNGSTAGQGLAQRPDTQLGSALNRLASLVDALQCAGSRAHVIADRAVGERPPATAEGGKPTPIRSGDIGRLETLLDQMQHDIEVLESANGRLSSFV